MSGKYKDMSPGEMYVTMGTDGKKWADAFCEFNNCADKGMMLSWFCSAIMAGYDRGVMIGKEAIA